MRASLPDSKIPDHLPVVVHQVHGIADVQMLLLRVVLIHDHVVVVDQRPALKKMKPAIQLA